jgi:large subunit ribosomal protein L11
MAKKIQATREAQIRRAKPRRRPGRHAPSAGVNIMDFCKNFNAEDRKGRRASSSVVVTVYADRSYTFITKTRRRRCCSSAPRTSPGIGEPNKNKVGR